MVTQEEQQNDEDKLNKPSSSSNKEIKEFVDWAIKQNPLVYKRLAEI